MNRQTRALRRALALACLAVACSSAPLALADDKKVAAQQLFDDANALTKAGDYANACPKFEESQRLDPQIGTLFWLADCQEHAHKLASAWANFVEVAERAANANKAAHAKQAQERADALKGRLCKMILVVSDEIRKTPSLELRRDDTLIGAAQFGVPLPVDAGKHVIKVAAPGRRSWETSVEATGEGNTFTVTIPALKEEPQVGLISTVPTTSPRKDGWPVTRTVGIVAGGLGIVGIGVGAAFGLVAAGKRDEANKSCDVDSCTTEGHRLEQQAFGNATASTAAFVAGGTLLAAGVALVLWPAPRSPAAGTSSTRVVIGPGSMFVQGAW